MFTVREAAVRLGNVSEATIYILCQRKLLGHVRVGVGRGAIRIPQEAIDAYVSKRTIPPMETASPPSPVRLKHLRG